MLVAKPLGVADWIMLGGVPGTLETITTPDSTVVVPSAANINFLNGTGMNITGSGNNITFNSTGAGLTWVSATSSTQAMAINTGYVANNGGGVTFTLPAVCPFGEVMIVANVNAGGFSIHQRVGQQIQLGKFATTSGTGGSLASTQIGDTVILVCTTANTNFLALSYVGDITYV